MSLFHIHDSKNPIEDANRIIEIFKKIKATFNSEYYPRRNELDKDRLLEHIRFMTKNTFEIMSLLYVHRANPDFTELLSKEYHTDVSKCLESILDLLRALESELRTKGKLSQHLNLALKTALDTLTKPIFNLGYAVYLATPKSA